jgi:hypothetical protein
MIKTGRLSPSRADRPPRQQELIREALEWFDEYLGPV